jgi:hypothetical protein
MNNHIEFESDNQLEIWLLEFNHSNCPNDEVTLPNIPYSFYEIRREIIRRENISGEI